RRTKLPASFQYTPTSGGGRFGPTVAGPARVTTVGAGGIGSIIAFTIESGTLAVFNALRPSTLVSKLIAPVPAALVVLILARITSSEMPEPTMAITSWFVSLRLTPEPSSQNADERRRKPKTNTRTTDPIRFSLIKLITEAPHLKLLQSNGPAEKRLSGAYLKRTAIQPLQTQVFP